MSATRFTPLVTCPCGALAHDLAFHDCARFAAEREFPRFFGGGNDETARAHRTRPRSDYARLMKAFA